MSEKNADNAMHQVFISYASDKGETEASDLQAAETVCSALEAQGIKCFIAHRDIEPGDDWLNTLLDAVEQCKVMVLVVSSNTHKSEWVKDEIAFARDLNIKIIPFRIEDVPAKGALRLLKVRCQWIDALTKPMNKHFDRLVHAVSRHLGVEIKTGPVDIIEIETVETTDSEPDESAKMPGDVKKVAEKKGIGKVSKNDKDFWQADFGDGIVMVYIPAGEFTMGQTDEENKWLIKKVGQKDYDEYYKDETPNHKVFLDGYWLGKHEVTVKQFQKFVQDSGYKTQAEKEDGAYTWTGKEWEKRANINWKTPGFSQDENHPVVCISWHDAVEYCRWLSKYKGLKFNLPTEAQWEKASRGADSRKYPWGNEPPTGKRLNFADKQAKEKAGISWGDEHIDDGYAYTAPVGSYPAGASPYGLLDMAGNVWEWCSDWYAADYYKNSPKENPAGPPSGSNRVMRGGSWYDFAGDVRCACRLGDGPAARGDFVGFRLAQDVK